MMIDYDWPWWIMFAAAMVSSYFREMRLRRERNDPRCTLFYTYQPAALKIGSPPHTRIRVSESRRLCPA